jgi:recombinational DNA repair ATPase RecF
LVLIDDLDAELDETSSRKMFELLEQNNVQTFISSLTKPPWIDGKDEDCTVFHVEHGKVEKMLE